MRDCCYEVVSGRKDFSYSILENREVAWNLPDKTQWTEWVKMLETKLLSRNASHLLVETQTCPGMMVWELSIWSWGRLFPDTHLLHPCSVGECPLMGYDCTCNHSIAHFCQNHQGSQKPKTIPNWTKKEVLLLDMFVKPLPFGRTGWGEVKCSFIPVRRLQLLWWDKKEQQKVVSL